jgi:hypothetical protein
MPRISLRTIHHWSVFPLEIQRFDLQDSCWRAEGLPLPTHPTLEDFRISRGHDGNGFYWLNEDCKRDCGEDNRRWSRSEAYRDTSMSIIGAGGGIKEYLGHVLRQQRRELRNQAIRERRPLPPPLSGRA